MNITLNVILFEINLISDTETLGFWEQKLRVHDERKDFLLDKV